MSWLDDLFGSSPSQGPGNPLGEPDDDQRMREHNEALAQLRADRKLNQLLARQEAERASAQIPTHQVSLGVPVAPDLVWNYVRDNPFGSAASPAADPLWAGVQPSPLTGLNYPEEQTYAPMPLRSQLSLAGYMSPSAGPPAPADSNPTGM